MLSEFVGRANKRIVIPTKDFSPRGGTYCWREVEECAASLEDTPCLGIEVYEGSY